MVAIAIFSADPAMRRSLEQLLREDSTFSIVGVVDDPTAISLLIDQNHVNVVLADVPPRERLADWRLRHNQTAFVIFVDGADEEDSLCAGPKPKSARLLRKANEVPPAMIPDYPSALSKHSPKSKRPRPHLRKPEDDDQRKSDV